MLERLHKHIISELQQGSRTDTIFVITGIAFNLIILGINSGIAGNDYNREASQDVLMVVFIILSILINIISISGLYVGRSTRSRLLGGLMRMYEDKEVAGYYDGMLVKNYERRYQLFIGAILCLGVTAVVVPLVLRFL